MLRLFSFFNMFHRFLQGWQHSSPFSSWTKERLATTCPGGRGGQLVTSGLFFFATPLKINIEPENDGLEDDVPFPGGPYSQVPAVHLPR